MSNWQEQLDRAERYYKKIKKLNDGIVHEHPLEEHVDDMITFFQHCYHVKDYLKNDPTFTKHTGSQIEDHVTNTQALAICADLCNGTKHLTLTRPRSGAEPKFGKKVITISLTDSLSGQEVPSTISAKFVVNHNGNELDAFTIATDALNAWKSFV